MSGLTLTEGKKVREITQRLSDLSSPVLRMQAILQFSQIVDILALGETDGEERSDRMKYIDELEASLPADGEAS